MTATIADRAPSNCEGLAAEPAPDLAARLAAIRTAEAEAWAAHDARLDEFRASIMAGLEELREFMAVPAWRRMLAGLLGLGDPA